VEDDKHMLKFWKNYKVVSEVYVGVYYYSLKINVFLFWIKLDSIMKEYRELRYSSMHS